LATELRWILLGLSLPLLAGIWWWTVRRAGQAPGNAELRESTAGKLAEPMPPLDPRYADSDDVDDGDTMRPEAESRDWGVPPFEPLNIRTAEFERVPVLDGPMMVNVDPVSFNAAAPAPAGAAPAGNLPWGTVPTVMPDPVAPNAATPSAATQNAAAPNAAVSHAAATAAGSSPAAAPPSAAASPPSVAPTPAANVAELQRIVTIRVCAVDETRWPGTELMAALELHGLAFGRYQVYHRKHVDGRSLFCVASLIEPGTFDLAEMPDQEFRGVTLFAVLPGPVAPLETMDELFRTARGLAAELSGMVQDGKGMPLSPQRAAAIREDIARFQASLPRN
jgi:cell division protein ZipA